MAKYIKIVVALVVTIAIGIGIGILIGKSINKKDNNKNGDLMDISDKFDFDAKSFTFDDDYHNIYVTGDFPSSITIEYTNNNKKDVGSYDVVATISDSSNKYIFPKTLHATMTILPADMNIEFNDVTFTFNDTEREYLIYGLDDRYSVTYYNNKHTEVGEYEVIAVIHDKLGNYNDLVLTATMIIREGNEYGVFLDNKTVSYNGANQSLTLSGNVDDCNVVYENNVQKNAGTYNVKAHITDPNGIKAPIDLDAVFIILKININATMEDEAVLIDNAEHTISPKNVPTGIEINYLTPKYTEAGTYEIRVVLSDPFGNYNDQELSANLTISTTPIAKMDNLRVLYDGLPHLPEVKGLIPSGITVTYYNDATGQIETTGFVNVAVYRVKAILHDTLDRYDDLILQATVTIVNAHRVVFKQDGAILESVYVEHGFKLDYYPQLPEEEGVEYYWEAEIGNLDNVTRDINVNLRKRAKTYTITYVTEFETDNPKIYNYSTDNTIKLNPLEVDGYLFMGWFLDEAYTNQIEEIAPRTNRNLVIYARMLPKTYTIDYYIRDELYKTVSVAYDNPVKIAEYEVDNFKSIKWVDNINNRTYNANEIISKYDNAKDITLDAILINNSYSFNVSLVNNKIVLTEYLGSSNGDEIVFIPNYYYYNDEWIEVSSIGDNAFKNYLHKNNIERIVVPNGIETIGSNAFEGLTKLKNIDLPDSLTRIGSKAFYNCTKLVTLTDLSSVEFIGAYAFENCEALEVVDVSNVSILTDGLFANSGLREVYIGKNITINLNAFDVEGVVTIHYPGTQAEFDALALTNLPEHYILVTA